MDQHTLERAKCGVLNLLELRRASPSHYNGERDMGRSMLIAAVSSPEIWVPKKGGGDVVKEANKYPANRKAAVAAIDALVGEGFILATEGAHHGTYYTIERKGQELLARLRASLANAAPAAPEQAIRKSGRDER